MCATLSKREGSVQCKEWTVGFRLRVWSCQTPSAPAASDHAPPGGVECQPPSVECQPPSGNRILPPMTSGPFFVKNRKKSNTSSLKDGPGLHTAHTEPPPAGGKADCKRRGRSIRACSAGVQHRTCTLPPFLGDPPRCTSRCHVSFVEPRPQQTTAPN